MVTSIVCHLKGFTWREVRLSWPRVDRGNVVSLACNTSLYLWLEIHCNYLEQTFISHCDFVSEVLFQLLKCVMFVHVPFIFQVPHPPRKNNQVRKLGRLDGVSKMSHDASGKHGSHTVHWFTCCLCWGTVSATVVQHWYLQHIHSNISRSAEYHFEVMATVQLPSSKKWGQIIPEAHTLHQIVAFELCRGFWTHCVVAYCSSTGSFVYRQPREVKMGLIRHN
jgi:hypothetical protein